MSRYSIEVFRTGKHVGYDPRTKAAVEIEYNENQLRELCNKYNSQSEHEAPIIIGHDEDFSPAFAWAEKFFVLGDRLWCTIKDVQPKFVDWVNSGLFKKKSIAIKDGNIRHVAFVPVPAVKGLRDGLFPVADGQEMPAFNFAAEDGVVVFESPFTTDTQQNANTNEGAAMDDAQFQELKGLLTTIANGMNSLLQKVGAAVPVAPPVAPPPAEQFSEKPLLTTVVATTANADEGLRAQVLDMKNKMRRAEAETFLNSGDIPSRVTAPMREDVINQMVAYADADERALESGVVFSDTNKSALDAYKERLKTWPVQVVLGDNSRYTKINASGSTEIPHAQQLGKSIMDAKFGKPAPVAQ